MSSAHLLRLRWLRLATRLSMLALLGVTASAAWRLRPPEPLQAIQESSLAPKRQLDATPATAVAERVSGGPASVSLLGFEILDPVLGLQSALAAPSTLGRVALALLLPLALGLLLGRVFCAYLCPVGWLATSLAWGRRRLQRVLPLPTLRLPASAGRWLLLGVLALSLAGLASSAALLLLHLQLQRLASAPADGSLLLFTAGCLLAFAVTELLLAPGAWCASLCPTGALYDLLARSRLFSLVKTGTYRCPRGCFRCDAVCWLHLQPRTGEVGASCDLCLSCAKVCPQRRLQPGRRRHARAGSDVETGGEAAGSGGLTGRAGAAGIALLILAAPLLSSCPAAELQPPQLDANPPWSSQINSLVAETWQASGAAELGLSIAFVERSEQGELYMFSAALWRAGQQAPPTPGAAAFELSSGAARATLRMAQPNAPRSTPQRALYAGRALVSAQGCHRLAVRVDGVDAAAELSFPPSRCDAPLRPLLRGALAWLGLLGLAALVAATAGSGRRAGAAGRSTGPRSRPPL